MTWQEHAVKCTLQISTQNSWIIWPVWPNVWVLVDNLSVSGFESCSCHLTFRFRVLDWVLITTVHLIVCSSHVTYTFQSEFTLYKWLNVNELLASSSGEIWCLSDCNGIGTQNYLVPKRSLNHLAKLAKWFSCVLSTYLYGACECMFLSCQVRV